MTAFKALLELCDKYGPWAIVLLLFVLFLRILLDEDRAALVRSRFYKIAYQVAGRHEDEKKFIANDIKGRLNLARKHMHFGKEVLPRAVDVSWVEGGDGKCQEIRDGEFVVRLDSSAQQEKNIALLATAIVKRTTLVSLRHAIERPLQSAIDLNLIRHLLMASRHSAALDWFLTNDYQRNLNCNEPTKARNRQIVRLDERGLFTRILLVELEEFSKHVYGLPPRPYMAGEIEGLVEFLYGVATRKSGQLGPLEYHRAYIRVGIIIVANTRKLLNSIEPYLKAMHCNLQKQLRSVYVLVLDKEWLGELNQDAYRRFEEQVKALSQELEKSTIAVKDFDVSFDCTDHDGRHRQARCIRFVTPVDPVQTLRASTGD